MENFIEKFSATAFPSTPLTMEDPVLGQPSENGGLGIFITKAVMSAVTYTYADGQNQLTLTKSW